MVGISGSLKDVGLTSILDGVGHFVVIKDRDLVWHYANDAACQLVGRSRKELIGRQDHEVFPKKQADAFAAADRRVLETGEEDEAEEELTTPDGRVLVLRAHKRRVLLPGPTGEEPWVVASLLDISDLRRTEIGLRESEAHYRYSVELNPQFPFTVAPDGSLLEMSPRWLKMVGLTPEEAAGSGWLKALHPDDLPGTIENWRLALRTECRVDHEKRIRVADGSYRWFRGRAAPRRDEAGEIVRWYGATEDVHERKMAEEALRESEQRFRLMADNAAVMIWVTDSRASVTMVNRVHHEFTGSPENETRGDGYLKLIHPDDLGSAQQVYCKAAAARSEYHSEFRLRRANGEWAWVHEHARPWLSSDGRLLGYVSSAHDVTEQKIQARAAEDERRRITHLALHDSLTGLPNRLCFDTMAKEKLFESHGATAVLLVDLDGFKPINDTLGHAAGDALLQSVAGRLRACLTAEDIVARLGGDEFVILHQLRSSGDDGSDLASSILESLLEPFEIEGAVTRVGASIGIALAPLHGRCKSSLLRAADAALYSAKDGGGGIWRHAQTPAHALTVPRPA